MCPSHCRFVPIGWYTNSSAFGSLQAVSCWQVLRLWITNILLMCSIIPTCRVGGRGSSLSCWRFLLRTPLGVVTWYDLGAISVTTVPSVWFWGIQTRSPGTKGSSWRALWRWSKVCFCCILISLSLRASEP